MDCYKCKTQYNDADHVPRLLIQCGHSICERCTSDLFSNYTIICPECNSHNYASSLQTFPKNLALLNVNETKNKKQIKTSSILTPKNDVICKKHLKKVEGYY